jgi:hypothetical protein
MPKRSSKKQPRDLNLLASNIVGSFVYEQTDEKNGSEKNPHAVALGRKGGLKGGVARAKKLSPTQRKKIAKKAALARWAYKEQK